MDYAQSPWDKIYFYSKYILHAMLSKTKDWRATENNSNIPNDTSCSNCQIFYSCECKWYLYSGSYELKTIAKNCISEKNEPARQCWDEFNKFNSKQEKTFWLKYLQKSIHYFKILNHMDKISYTFSSLWGPS